MKQSSHNLILIFCVCLFLFCDCSSEKVDSSENSYLIEFAELFGYIRHFYPYEQNKDFDWDRFLVYGVKRVRSCSTDKEFKSLMSTLFDPVAPYLVYQNNNPFNSRDYLKNNDSILNNYRFWQHQGYGKIDTSALYRKVLVNSTNYQDLTSDLGKIKFKIPARQITSRQIRLECNFKLTNSLGSIPKIAVRSFSSDKRKMYRRKDVNGLSSDWSNYSAKFDVIDGIEVLEIELMLIGKGTIFIDSLVVHSINPDGTKGNETLDLVSGNSSDFFELEKIGVGYDIGVLPDSTASNKSYKISYHGKYRSFEGEEIFRLSDDSLKSNILFESETGLKIKVPLFLNKEKLNNSNSTEKLVSMINSLNCPLNDINLRIANIIEIVNVIRHFYPYNDIVEVDWDQVLNVALQKAKSDTEFIDHINTIEKLLSVVKDGHCFVDFSGRDYYNPPILWEIIEDELIITFVSNDLTDVKVGDIVQEIDRKPWKIYFDSVRNTVSSATTHYKNFQVEMKSLFGKKDSYLELTVNSKPVKIQRTAFNYEVYDEKIKHQKINDDIYYANLNVLSMKEVADLFDTLKSYNAIIFDLRDYPNRNLNLIYHLMGRKDTTRSWLFIPNIIHPNYQRVNSFKPFSWNIEPKTPYLGDRKMYFISGRQSISAAESFFGYVKAYNLGTIIGETTAGTNGNKNIIKLPGDIKISWTGMKVTNHDHSQFYGIGIIPDISVSRTMKGVMENKDELLEKAIEVASKKKF